MSETTETTWECGRCNAVKVVKGTGQPDSWSRLLLATPPRHAEPTSVVDLCSPCATHITRIAQGKAA